MGTAWFNQYGCHHTMGIIDCIVFELLGFALWAKNLIRAVDAQHHQKQSTDQNKIGKAYLAIK